MKVIRIFGKTDDDYICSHESKLLSPSHLNQMWIARWIASISPVCLTIPIGSSFALAQPPLSDSPPGWYNCLSREVFTPEKKVWCDR